MFRLHFLAIFRELLEDGQEMRTKNVGAIIYKYKHNATSYEVLYIYSTFIPISYHLYPKYGGSSIFQKSQEHIALKQRSGSYANSGISNIV
jgi:hypothetical protein